MSSPQDRRSWRGYPVPPIKRYKSESANSLTFRALSVLRKKSESDSDQMQAMRARTQGRS
jgi:hypothetical protein